MRIDVKFPRIFTCVLPLAGALTVLIGCNREQTFRISEFERIVAQYRAGGTVQKPIRIVVSDEDHSLFVGANVFEQVIYDETDEIARNTDILRGYWPDPTSDTGIIDVGYGRKSVTHISGHFYRVSIVDP